MEKTLVTLALMLAATLPASGQGFTIDPARDLALTATIRAFLDDNLTADQLERDLREYAREFEARPYNVGTANIDWEKLAQERLFAFVRVLAAITMPVQQAFLKGELTPAQAALKMAPFFLMWSGYGMDAPPGEQAARARIYELLLEIGKFHAPGY